MMSKLISIALVFIIVSCSSAPASPTSTPTPDICGPDAMMEYYDTIRDVGRRFDDAETLANNTSRMNLPPVIGDLQAIRRDAEDLIVPDCAKDAQDLLVKYMNSTIDGYLAFMSDEADSTVSSYFKAASNYMNQYSIELEKMIALPTPGG